ncbi:solute carrier family 25 member 36-A-like isoform X1 [Daphnia pulex]|uniref:Uncharacterized protein n=2 Tax=Daphnia pulex TaxID=6669 RepID=E9HM83_DAPPU|nr:solute carrier family 25 member 36-A-like isoform X1 [Daphnia pulex]EFX67098.1 hypothetical protein DAPPUDRAFT_189549 [Daphnia pulex]|eukprot:EFX67098.1 hypothetical protein DAPPUDRAFT_189549 [Daphnia pulex]
MSNADTFIHLFAGGVGGTVGAIVTCPLEVIKTRLQSSSSEIHYSAVRSLRTASSNAGCSANHMYFTPEMNWNVYYHHQQCSSVNSRLAVFPEAVLPWPASSAQPKGALSCFRHLIDQEGCRALFKGLGPNLIGVAPTRALYFCTYSTAKRKFNQIMTPDSHLVHMLSAGSAGFVSCTLTNPIWFVKTRLQLNRNQNVTAWQCISNIYRSQGVVGFYRGITASYFGISETIIKFVLYEYLKSTLQQMRETQTDSPLGNYQAMDYMLAGAISKTVACCVSYPHEVVRTRLREENSRYRGFFQTLHTVFREEGHRGLYRGLSTQLIRQIPNTAIMMTTYEATVYVLNSLVNEKRYTGSE